MNLGIKTFEIRLTPEDKVTDLVSFENKILSEHERAYLLVRSPINVPELLNGLPDAGYKFIEAYIQLSLKKVDYIQPKFLNRLDSKATVKIADDLISQNRAFEEIAQGMFDTDRISIDNAFGPEYAAKRYTNWIRLLISNGRKIHEVFMEGEPIGFFILDPLNDQKVRGILTGLYKKYETSGFGTLIMKKLNDTAWELGHSTFLATVVSNNLKALRSNLIFGSTVTDIEHNYFKHLRK